jgi:hypothetical protein
VSTEITPAPPVAELRRARCGDRARSPARPPTEFQPLLPGAEYSGAEHQGAASSTARRTDTRFESLELQCTALNASIDLSAFLFSL